MAPAFHYAEEGLQQYAAKQQSVRPGGGTGMRYPSAGAPVTGSSAMQILR